MKSLYFSRLKVTFLQAKGEELKMSKFLKNILLDCPVVLGMALLIANSAVAQEAIPNNQNSQIPSPTERYGCLSGNSDRTFQGNQPVTRYEFAAGLNACLNQV